MTNLARHSILPVSAAFTLAYVALEWLSQFPIGAGSGIRPWHLPPALALALLLVGGLRYAPALFPAALLAELFIRPAFQPMPVVAVAAACVAAVSPLVTALALRRFPNFDFRLASRLDVTLFALAVAGVAFAATLVRTLLRLAVEPLDADAFARTLLQSWIAETIAIFTLAPLLLMASDPKRRQQLVEWIRTREFALQITALMLVLWFILGVRLHEQFKHFYLLFMPLLWFSMRRGLLGAATANVVLISSLIVGIVALGFPVGTFVDRHWIMLALATTGLFVGITVDERQRALEQLNRSLRLAAAAETAAALAHELNQPLTAIASYAKSAQMMLGSGAPDDPRLTETIDKIAREAVRAGSVVHGLREFLRSGATRLSTVDIARLVDDVEFRFRDAAERRGVVLTARVDPSLRAITADRTQIEIVLRNLVANAIDSVVAEPEGHRRISVEAEPADEGNICFRVRDSGSGAGTSVIEPRLGEFVSSKAHGMGLGLNITRAIVEAHGGRLQCESTPESVFFFTIPTIQRDARDSTKPDQTVFVVDDDASVRDSLGLLLGLHGYRTAMFSSGEAFLAAARSTWRGCVLLDVRMNGATGLAVQASMREQGIRLPVIIITAHGDVATTRAAFKAEAVDLLEKPIDNDILIRTIDQALELDARNSSSAKQANEYAERIASLSQRERDVMFRIARGEHNRDVAEALGISPRTVEVYRARMMKKLGADSLSDLVRIALSHDAGQTATQ